MEEPRPSRSSTDGHVHQVLLAQAELLQLAANLTIVVTTTRVESHTHVFSLFQNAPSASTPTTDRPTEPRQLEPDCSP